MDCLRRTVLLTGLMTLPAGAALAFTPEPGPPIGQAVPNRPRITSATDRLKAEQERFGDFRSEAFKQGLMRARQEHLEQSRPHQK
jgi:hypothetical protein